MAFIFFRPVFWLIVCWIFVYMYVDAGLAVDNVDKAHHIRQARQFNSINSNNSSAKTTGDKDPTMPNSSYSIFHPGQNGSWIDKLYLLSVMLISGMGVVGKLVIFNENHPDILLT